LSDLPTAGEWAARVAAVLDGLTDLTGDRRFRRAAGILRGKRIGRRAVDDTQALVLARSLLDAKLVPSRTAAVKRAALLTAEPHQIESAIRRLLKKFCDESFKSQDVEQTPK
jgi:hypothetical protein